MVQKLNWEKLRWDRKPKRSLKDEAEFRANDVAARWLAKAEARLAEKQRKGLDQKKSKSPPSRHRKYRHPR